MNNNNKIGHTSKTVKQACQLIRNTGASSHEMMSLIIVMCIVAALTLLSVHILKNKFQHDIENALQNVLNVTKNGFLHEEKRQLNIVQLHAQSDEIIELTERLLTKPAAGSNNESTTSQQQALAQLRHYFALDLAEKRHLGFYIIAPDNFNIASANDNDLGQINPMIAQPDLLQKLWSGKPALTRIQHSNLTLTDDRGQLIHNPATMFVGAPIRNKSNRVIALLALRINPYDTLFPLLEKEHLGKTGETYAFDKNGLMLSHSRFENQLQALNLLGNLKGEDKAIHLYNPGTNLLEHPEKSASVQPILTDMAANAIKGLPGRNVEGYRDYRGVPVVGAWHWFPEVEIGITTEQELSDAYGTYYYTRNLILAVSSIGCTLVVLLLVVSFIRRQRIQASEAYLDAIYKTSNDALVIIDQWGIIQHCNPTTEKLFGYTEKDLEGKNVKLLMPEPYRSQHDVYLKNYNQSGKVHPETAVLGMVRELLAVRSDGTIFPIELNVNPLSLPDGTFFAGSIRDISKRKQAEEEAKESERHLTNTLKHAQVGTWNWSRTTQEIIHSGNTAIIYGLETSSTPEDLSIKKASEFIENVHPEDRSLVSNAINASRKSGNRFNIEYRVIWPDQSIHWIYAQGDVVFDEDGQPTNTMGIVQDITQQKELEQELKDSAEALKESEHHLSNILNTAPVNIYIKNLEGKYIFVNPSWEASVGLNRVDVLGKSDEDLFPQETAELYKSTQEMALKNKQSITIEEDLQTKDGRDKAFMTSLFPLKNTAGDVYALGGWSAEITNLKKTQRDLEVARQDADASNKAKSSFLAAMSHEIRTPMNGVVGIVDVLDHTNLDEEQQRLVKTINDSSLSLLSIIDAILDFSKIEAGKMELEHIPICLEDILDSVGETLLPLATKKGIELITYSDPDLPDFYGDPVRIKQVLYNISGNAIKFTESTAEKKGRVVIKCEKSTIDSEDNSLISLSIEDNGIGISPEGLKGLFNPFAQAESSTTREYGGTGLGLTISKRLAQLMNGDISVNTQEGVGTTFAANITLTPSREEKKETYPELKNITALLLKGDQQVDDILANYLRWAGIKLFTTSYASSIPLPALPADQEGPTPTPLIVVIDTENHSGDISDIQTKLLNHYGKHWKIHFILIHRGSRRKARALSENTLNLDMNSLSKSVFIDTVAGAAGLITPELGTKDTQETYGNQPVLSSEDAAQRGLLFLIAEDNPVNQRVINHQLNLLGYSAETANDGLEALEMWESGGGKYSLILTDCHMPRMDGYDLAKAIRKREDITQQIPIIAITADAMKGTKQACLNAGMNDYITKPLRISALDKKISEWLPKAPNSHEEPDNTEQTNAVDVTENPAIAEKPSNEAINPKALKELLFTDDPALLAEFYHEFLASARPTVSLICAAIEENDFKAVSEQSHKLKSSSYSVGANKLADCCLLLETSGKLGEDDVLKENLPHLKNHMEMAENWIQRMYPESIIDESIINE